MCKDYQWIHVEQGVCHFNLVIIILCVCLVWAVKENGDIDYWPEMLFSEECNSDVNWSDHERLVRAGSQSTCSETQPQIQGKKQAQYVRQEKNCWSLKWERRRWCSLHVPDSWNEIFLSVRNSGPCRSHGLLSLVESGMCSVVFPEPS